ncbi:MAG: type I restriction enzyme HsdR N-terminal domain-containing protein [Spirochaetaceae bacterium]|nr:type I restriction enzyme HsdR N-terminal domain-containing protein [Spirochaetaceae bacterium]
MTKEQLFGNINFEALKNDANFKEDSVREVMILPLIKALGYEDDAIERSKSLKHPFLKVGSNKKVAIKLIPDYLLKIDDNYVVCLDAKAPNIHILDNDHIEQVYSYSAHTEVRATYFALCNGVQFALWRREESKPLLVFNLNEIEYYWQRLFCYISPYSIISDNVIYTQTELKHDDSWYKSRKLPKEIQVKKRAVKRHFGVHGYFTRQSWDIVQTYIENFSQPSDVVLDPFGGSGVTAIEAMMSNREAIHLDLNPLSIFMTEALLAPITEEELTTAFVAIKEQFKKFAPKTDEDVEKALKKYPLPKGLRLALPKDADVAIVGELFTKQQLAELALLKFLIKKHRNKNLQKILLLMFSGTVTRVNLTYHVSTSVKAKTGFGGNAAAFQYYRYRIAKEPTYVDVLTCFEMRYQKVKAAKMEMAIFLENYLIRYNGLPQVIQGTATQLPLEDESIDYIYTDPPYGKKIPYLDLSVMWNAWLDFEVTEEDYLAEAIEGGEHNQSKETYNKLIAESIREMYRVLKYDRWLTFVFAHKDPEFWDLIKLTAELSGFEYVGATAQPNGQTSFKKRQKPFAVLSGQLMISFKKVKNPRVWLSANLGMDIGQIILQTIEGVIAKNNGATIEQINNELIIRGLELGFLDLLKKEYEDLAVFLTDFDFEEKTELYKIKKNTKFKTHINIELRIKYYLISHLRRAERANNVATFDEIVLNIMPLLKNGSTPEGQTILGVLQEIAEQAGDGGWRLKQEGQRELFN